MNKKIRILFTIPNFDKAGSGKVVYDLVSGLNPEKFEVEIACRHNKGDFFNEIKALNLPIHLLDTTTNYKPYTTLIFRINKLKKFFKNQKFDIVHSWQWSSDWTETLATRLSGTKWIYTKKAMSWNNVHWKIKSWLANYIITINNEMYDYFPKKKNQKLIPLGIDTEYYNPNLFPDTKNSKFEIIVVANLVPVKGVEVLINAFNEIDNENLELTLLGNKDNEYGSYLEEFVKELNLESKIKFLGKHPDVRPYIKKASLYVIPTLNEGRKEGMPMALVEAMSMGIPVLGSDISGINYVLKDFKELLFEAGNTEALKLKLLQIINLSEIERKELGVRLRNYCISNFSEEKFISAHEQLYNELISK